VVARGVCEDNQGRSPSPSRLHVMLRCAGPGRPRWRSAMPRSRGGPAGRGQGLRIECGEHRRGDPLGQPRGPLGDLPVSLGPSGVAEAAVGVRQAARRSRTPGWWSRSPTARSRAGETLVGRHGAGWRAGRRPRRGRCQAVQNCPGEQRRQSRTPPSASLQAKGVNRLLTDTASLFPTPAFHLNTNDRRRLLLLAGSGQRRPAPLASALIATSEN
jgi:hypothetical protein